MQKFIAVCCATLCLAFAGCGSGAASSYVPVEGTVTLKGEPLSGATVTLRPVTPDPKMEDESLGATDASGKFTIKTGDKDGCPAGSYMVGISKFDGQEETLPKYCRPIDSMIKLEVAPSMEAPTFELQ